MKNKAAVMTDIRKVEMQEIPMPRIKSNQVLIKIEYAGICGSDVHYYEHGRIGDYVVETPFILGHECAGTVVEIGCDVKSVKVGDKVAPEPGVTCGKCEYCLQGKYNLCADVEFLATPPYDGSFVSYLAFPEHMAFVLPENMSTKQGALVEPLAVGLHASALGGVGLGSKVVILGAGCIGLVTLLSCIARGATEIVVVDIIEKRLEYAKKLGATRVINAKDVNVAEELADSADVVIETAGAVVTIQQTPYIAKRGAKIVLVGLAPKDIIDFDFMQIMWKEASIESIFRYRNMYPIAINAIASGKIDVEGLITHEFAFDDTKKALDFVIENKNDVVKAVIKIG